ncbi:MAG: methionyl-tRNA formyltransferase, partial [Solirubrobacterales bacterium]|nr:methionyl-tRNA formyltransferase [Solirubrobacterales bacterium]
DDVHALDLSGFDDVVVCAFGVWIKEPLISHPGLINIHPSLLPRWRGAAPIERAIMAGDSETGVSIMRVTAGLDSGPVCAQAREWVAPGDSYGTLAPRLAELGGELLVRALDQPPPFTEQDQSLATYAEKITAEDRRLDGGRSALELERVVRALHPHVGAFVELSDGGRLGVIEARAVATGPPAGSVALESPAPLLGCAEGALELTVVQPPGKRPMSADAYLRGLRR